MDKLLWGYKEIADQLGYSPRYVRDKVMKDEAAPEPVFPGKFRPSDIRQFLNVVQSRKRVDCNKSSHASGLSTQTSGTGPKRPASELNE
jgi:hypothetical protein